MAQQAEVGHYDDFLSQSAFPQHQLIHDLVQSQALSLAARARRGEFEATFAEAQAWADRNNHDVPALDMAAMFDDFRHVQSEMADALTPDRRTA
jgi:hypothetical protein